MTICNNQIPSTKLDFQLRGERKGIKNIKQTYSIKSNKQKKQMKNLELSI